MRSKVTTAPAIEPVTLTELKASLRVTGTAEDTLLTQYISDARELVERITGRKLINQTITAYYTGLGENITGQWWSGTRVAHERVLYGTQQIELEFAPVQSITTLHAIESDNSATLIASTDYYLDNYDDDMRSRVKPVTILTAGSRIENNIKCIYVAGYGTTAASVPSALRRAVLVLAGMLYSNRGDCGEQCQTNCGATQMMQPYIIKNA